MKALYVQMMDRHLIFRFLKGRCHGNQIICERQVQHGQKTGVFCQIFPDLLDLFSQSFHHMKAHYVQMMDLSFFPNLVNFRPVISEFTLLKRAIFAAMHPQFYDDLLAFRNGWKIAILISAE